MIPINLFNQLLALATIGMQVAIVVLLLSIVTYSKIGYAKALVDIVGKNAIAFAGLIALAATVGSLIYSEVAQFEPCNLCWYQRMFIYPQVILLGIALFKKDSRIVDYILGLSIVGGVIAAYHYFIQITQTGGTLCSALEGSTSCITIFFIEYGYITIPFMSLVTLSLIIVIMVAKKIRKTI